MKEKKKIEQFILGVNGEYLSEEVIMWRAVIMQALDDLKLLPTNKKYRSWKRRAIKWFTDADEDFYEVCELADLSPQYILQYAHYLMVRNN